MTRTTITAALLLAICEPALAAQCELSTLVETSPLPTQKLLERDNLYLRLCRLSDGNLVDGEDRSLRDRLMLYGMQSTSRRMFQIDDDLRRNLRETVTTLGYVVEADGKVSYVSVINSSGNQRVDQLVRYFAAGRKMDPPTLDGQPVRVFLTTRCGATSDWVLTCTVPRAKSVSETQ
ncbi:MAG: energy transducer TonB [Gammaproteobacteria bacterium]|nr:energy transducer TonB [Pseudomonadota bacterium]MCC6631564.1 energy transducer TonB [Gammaproteobacteria bacterium]